MSMDMRKEQWINGKTGIENTIDYSKKIEQWNIGIEKQPKSIKDHSKEEEDQRRGDGDENEERRRKTNVNCCR
jgi:hypothetical protein